VEDNHPDGSERVSEPLRPVAEALQDHTLLSQWARFEFRLPQIKVEPAAAVEPDLVWGLLQQIVYGLGLPGLAVLRSSHSMDVLAPGVTKGAVLDRVKELLPDTENPAILCIGDRGQWPGNDFCLLESPYSLSVDEVSQDPSKCWNLASPGHRGTQATLEYLRALRPGRGLQFVRNGASGRRK